MAARSIGTATISFGLVSIPIKLYSATQAQSAITFNQLHVKCGGRVKQQYICPRDNNEVVERDQLVKGYEFAKDRYVIFTPEELKALEEKATQSIDIAEFVPADKIDPIYFDKAYYLGPDKGGDRAYRLLSEVMLRTKRTALARYAARGKQYLVQLRPVAGGGIVLQQLLYSDEVRPFAEVDLAKMDVKEQELKLATSIVEQIATEEFKPEQYVDDVKTRMQEQIQRKVEGQEIQISTSEQPATQVIDLMEALKASLLAREGKSAGATNVSANAKREDDGSQAAERTSAGPGGGEPGRPKLAAVPLLVPEIERKPAKRAPREKSEKGETKSAKK